MDDAEWLFKQDSKEKKITARSARKKVRHTGCKLPSDYLTNKQKKQLNGEVFSVNIHKPMTYKYFKTLPKDLQQEFLDWVVKTFGVSQKDACKEMFKVAPTSLINYIKKVGLKTPFSRNGILNVPYNREAWLKFLAGEEVEESQNAPESCENDLCETNGSSEGMDISVENASESDEKAPKEAEETKLPDYIDLVNEVADLRFQNDMLKGSNDFMATKLKENEIRQYVENDIRALDEIVIEQPFEVGSLNFNLKNIRDWDALKECLSAFPLPAYNSVTITVHALRKEEAQ